VASPCSDDNNTNNLMLRTGLPIIFYRMEFTSDNQNFTHSHPGIEHHSFKTDMVALNREPSISKLGRDLLWKVFLINSDTNSRLSVESTIQFNEATGKRLSRDEIFFIYSPLTIARRSSQVCRLWRDIILSSPSLWGRIIDFDYLKQ
jgi:hypothetical protein